jgi:hypothetical protein
MRAYKGRIEGPLGAKMKEQAPPAPPPPKEERKPARLATPRPMTLPGPQPAAEGSSASNLIAIAAIVVLSVAAVALTVALLMK